MAFCQLESLFFINYFEKEGVTFMISEKMQYSVKNSSVIRAMFEEGKKMALQYGEENVFDFSLGNPSVEPPDSVKKAIFTILEKDSPNFVHGYTNNSGYEDVRRFIADSTNHEFKTNFSYENVIMTNGAAGGLNIIFKTLLNPGDEVIVIAPFFGEYQAYIQNYNGKLVVVPANTETFQINLSALEEKITQKTKAVIINSPNNPSGAVYSENTICSLASILEQKEAEFGTSIYLISDEPYRRLAYDQIEVPFVSQYYKNTFVAYSFSKSLSLPGERIGYVLVNTEADSFEEIMQALNVANRILGFVNAPSLFQRIIPACMEEKTDLETYDKNRNLLYSMLIDLGFSCLRPVGAFYLFPKTLISDDIAFCNAAKEFHLLTVPGTSFHCPGHFRLSYCVPTKIIERSYDSFKKLSDKYKR